MVLRNANSSFFLLNKPLKLLIFFIIVFSLSNLSAIVDHFLHPQIPYFDEEHIIVGGVTGLVSGILFFIVFLYTRYLEQILSKIKILESFLSICANCKKIRIKNTDNALDDSWQQIESYLKEHTGTDFSHGICPDCTKKLYPDLDIYGNKNKQQ